MLVCGTVIKGHGPIAMMTDFALARQLQQLAPSQNHPE
jgi:hypothetical protein